MNSFLRGLISQILEVLLDEGTVFLRVLFRLGLEDGGAVAFWQADVTAGAGPIAARAIGAAGAVPIALAAGALRWRSAATLLALAGLLPLTLSLPLPLLLALSLRHLRAETCLGEGERGKRLFQGLRRGVRT